MKGCGLCGVGQISQDRQRNTWLMYSVKMHTSWNSICHLVNVNIILILRDFACSRFSMRAVDQ